MSYPPASCKEAASCLSAQCGFPSLSPCCPFSLPLSLSFPRTPPLPPVLSQCAHVSGALPARGVPSASYKLLVASFQSQRLQSGVFGETRRLVRGGLERAYSFRCPWGGGRAAAWPWVRASQHFASRRQRSSPHGDVLPPGPSRALMTRRHAVPVQVPVLLHRWGLSRPAWGRGRRCSLGPHSCCFPLSLGS